MSAETGGAVGDSWRAEADFTGRWERSGGGTV